MVALMGMATYFQNATMQQMAKVQHGFPLPALAARGCLAKSSGSGRSQPSFGKDTFAAYLIQLGSAPVDTALNPTHGILTLNPEIEFDPFFWRNPCACQQVFAPVDSDACIRIRTTGNVAELCAGCYTGHHPTVCPWPLLGSPARVPRKVAQLL